MLHDGHVHTTGTPEEVFRSTDPIVHAFVNGISELPEPAAGLKT